ncbi:MAG: hypothetical protein A2Z03_11485 [Chloroflexi bacterium RBG_16_56_8]|nr:MAG: hypothetical protein A2Z03_11485 [Chloroflexi bacterium RBG_16_56_8]
MIRKETLFTLVVLAALIGFAVYLNRRQSTVEAEATPTSGVTYVFTSEDGLPSSIEIAPADGETVRIARNAENVWVLELPTQAAADQGLAEAAATQVSTLRALNKIEGDPEIFGLDQPAYVVTIGFTGGREHTLDIGSTTPSDSGYYVRLDGKEMMIVGLSGLEGLLNLASAPPYLETATPSPLPPTETPVPAVEATATTTP